jgi:hypothetical protein
MSTLILHPKSVNSSSVATEFTDKNGFEVFLILRFWIFEIKIKTVMFMFAVSIQFRYVFPILNSDIEDIHQKKIRYLLESLISANIEEINCIDRITYEEISSAQTCPNHFYIPPTIFHSNDFPEKIFVVYVVCVFDTVL